jgi:hypothetical protein
MRLSTPKVRGGVVGRPLNRELGFRFDPTHKQKSRLKHGRTLLCGAVRYRLASPPQFTHCCHCRWCQRQTGSACVVNAMIETDRIQLLAGEPEMVSIPSPSGMGPGSPCERN